MTVSLASVKMKRVLSLYRHVTILGLVGIATVIRVQIVLNATRTSV